MHLGLVNFIVNQLLLNMFQASLRPSSGGQTAFSLHMVICPVATVGESAGKLCALCGVGCVVMVVTTCTNTSHMQNCVSCASS